MREVSALGSDNEAQHWTKTAGELVEDIVVIPLASLGIKISKECLTATFETVHFRGSQVSLLRT